MVNPPLTVRDDPSLVIDAEVTLALAYAPGGVRERLRALWALDARLGVILKTTREPLVGQMRLMWWHDAVAEPDKHRGEPVLAALARTAFDAKGLQRIVTGWEALLDGDNDTALSAYAADRGGGLFALAAHALGATDAVGAAGTGWALVDLARHHSRADVAQRALTLAEQGLAATPMRWTRSARPLGMLAKLARRDLRRTEVQGSPRRIAAMALLALTGR